eukprot:4636196-Ditylum_brightwellii.AAC.1
MEVVAVNGIDQDGLDWTETGYMEELGEITINIASAYWCCGGISLPPGIRAMGYMFCIIGGPPGDMPCSIPGGRASYCIYGGICGIVGGNAGG